MGRPWGAKYILYPLMDPWGTALVEEGSFAELHFAGTHLKNALVV